MAPSLVLAVAERLRLVFQLQASQVVVQQVLPVLLAWQEPLEPWQLVVPV